MHRRISSRRDAHAIHPSDTVFDTPIKRNVAPHGRVLAPSPAHAPSTTAGTNVPLDSPVYRYGEGNGYGHGYAYGQGTGTGIGLAAQQQYEPGLGMSSGFGAGLGGSVRDGVGYIVAGLRDAGRLDRSVGLMLSDAELRSNFIKSCLINTLCLLSVAVFDHLLIPAIGPLSAHFSTSASLRTRWIAILFDVFWKYPAFALCFWVNGSWSHTISHRALTLQHPSSRQAAGSTGTTATTARTSAGSTVSPFFYKLMSSVPRLLLILNFTFISYALTYVPLLGRLLAFIYTCWANAFYCFDFSFSRRELTLRTIAQHMDERLPYYLGFGLIPSMCCSFGPPLINMASFALVYPFFVIQALHARPVPAASAHTLDSPGDFSPSPSPSPGPGSHGTFASSAGYFSPSPRGARSRSQTRPRLPIFALAIKALDVFTWLERSLGRRIGRAGSAGPGAGGGGEGPEPFGMRRLKVERSGKKHF